MTKRTPQDLEHSIVYHSIIQRVSEIVIHLMGEELWRTMRGR